MKIKVTIIDDHTLFREGLQRLLIRHDIDVIASVSGGDEGIKSIEENLPDIVLLDLRMPNESGIDVLKKLREKWTMDKSSADLISKNHSNQP